MLLPQVYGILEFINKNNMDTLKQKEKRWFFLNELYNRGVESVGFQLEKTAGEIMLIKIELELKRKKEERDSKINSILN